MIAVHLGGDLGRSWDDHGVVHGQFPSIDPRSVSAWVALGVPCQEPLGGCLALPSTCGVLLVQHPQPPSRCLRGWPQWMVPCSGFIPNCRPRSTQLMLAALLQGIHGGRRHDCHIQSFEPWGSVGLDMQLLRVPSAFSPQWICWPRMEMMIAALEDPRSGLPKCVLS